MKIEILGMGCPKCKKLTENAEAAVAALGIPCAVEKVTDPRRFSAYKVVFTPALVIDGAVKCAGRIASPAEIQTWLTSALDAGAQT